VRDPGLAGVLEARGVDVVVHLAAIVNPRPGDPPGLAWSVDVEGTRNVLAACVAAGVSRLIVTSSGAAYGYHADNDPLLTEDSPLRGNHSFPYARHKRIVEEDLARYRREHPELAQLIFRPGTVLGRSVDNQITALFQRPVVMGLRDAATPFCFVWDEDVAACVVEGVHGDQEGAYNLAGDGVMTLREIARRLEKPYVGVPSRWLEAALRTLKRLDLSRYGPEQVDFLRFRPVLSGRRLEREFGYRLRRNTREVFEIYCEGRADA